MHEIIKILLTTPINHCFYLTHTNLMQFYSFKLFLRQCKSFTYNPKSFIKVKFTNTL